MKANLRRSFLLLVLNALLLTMVAPAIADPPTEGSFQAVFDDVDPCTGDLHEVTIFIDFFLHEHPNNFVANEIRTGFTDSGYEMFAGDGNVTITTNIFKQAFKDMWRHDDGRMFLARGVFVLNFDTGEVQADNVALECIGGETIL